MNLDIVPIPKTDQEAALAALKAYKAQNPVKYEQKKEALFARYGLAPETPVEVVQDENDKELEELTKTVKAKKNAK